jgi:hypothetical protein
MGRRCSKHTEAAGGGDYRLWKHGDRLPSKVRLRGAAAVDVVLMTRRKRAWLEDPELARWVFEWAESEPGSVAVAVLPDRVCWLLDDASQLDRTMAGFRGGVRERLERDGIGEGRLWQRGFWYRPLADATAREARAYEIFFLPKEHGLLERHPDWPQGMTLRTEGEGMTWETSVRWVGEKMACDTWFLAEGDAP